MEENNTTNLSQNEEIKPSVKSSQRNVAFLNELYKNAVMGKLAFEYILHKVKDKKLKDELLKQYHDFEKITASISGAIVEHGKTPKSSLGIAKLMLNLAINMTTMFDSSASKISEMMIQGDNKGIMDVNRLINRSADGIPEKSLNLAYTLLETEQRHIDSLKAFL